jgi:hypothetical protein
MTNRTQPLKGPEGTVYINDSNGMHRVFVKKNNKMYYAGQYKKINEARELQKECYERLKNKTFEEWNANRRHHDQGFNKKLKLFTEYHSEFGDIPSSSQMYPTIYKGVNLSRWWVGQKVQFRAGNMREWKIKAFRDHGIDLEKYTKTPEKKGVYYSKVGKRWQAFFIKDKRMYPLGDFTDYKKMIRLCEEAEKHKDDFLEWYKENKKTSEKRKVNPISKTKGVTYNKTSGKWKATYCFEKKTYSLGYYEKVEDAIRARKEAEKHADDFLKWQKEKNQKGEVISKNGNARIRKITLYQVEVMIEGRNYRVGKVQDLRRAEKIQDKYCECKDIKEINSLKSKEKRRKE